MTIALVQTKFAGTNSFDQTCTFDSTPTSGNLILAAVTSRGASHSCFGSVMTQVQQTAYRDSEGDSSTIGLWKHISDARTSYRFQNGSSSALCILLMEFSGVDTEDVSGSAKNQSPSSTPSIPGASPNTSKSTALLVDVLGWKLDEFSGVPTYTVGSGWTQDVGTSVSGLSGQSIPFYVVSHQIVTPPTGALANAHSSSQGVSRIWGYLQAAFNLASDTGPTATPRARSAIII